MTADAASRGRLIAPVAKLSGPPWRTRFPGSSDTAALAEPFRSNVRAFVLALTSAGASVAIHSTYRPLERAYLMHWAHRVAHGHDPAAVPPQAGVDIAWQHRGQDGRPDRAASQAAAVAMVAAYGIVFEPRLDTRHADRLAIDMDIAWAETLTVVDGRGRRMRIATTPRTGSGNAELHEVGASFGVVKLVADLPHWSHDGS